MTPISRPRPSAPRKSEPSASMSPNPTSIVSIVTGTMTQTRNAQARVAPTRNRKMASGNIFILRRHLSMLTPKKGLNRSRQPSLSSRAMGRERAQSCLKAADRNDPTHGLRVRRDFDRYFRCAAPVIRRETRRCWRQKQGFATGSDRRFEFLAIGTRTQRHFWATAADHRIQHDEDGFDAAVSAAAKAQAGKAEIRFC